MQTPNEKKQMFLDMQEHPEKYSDEQLESMMDELDRLPDVDKAWHKFEQNHHQITMRSPRSWLKVAASIIGVIMASGIAFAAVHIVRHYQKPQTPKAEQTTYVKVPINTVPTDITTDTTAVEPRIFDNVSLDTMLNEIASTYHVAVEFQREESRQLRFHFEWNSSESINRVVERLNNFEAVDIICEREKLIVK